MTQRPLIWVVGSGGLLGSAIDAAYTASGTGRLWSPGISIPWDSEAESKAELAAAVKAFFNSVESSDADWRVLWCAGSGVVSTGSDALAVETRVFGSFVDALATNVPALHGVGRGAMFFASSAGAVYGGSSARPSYDEWSPVGVRSDYGAQKLAQEALARHFAERTRTRLLIGRISNLYGPGQNTRKPQGLVIHIGRAALRREPLHVYVPLSTIRDYLLASDAAQIVVRSVDRLMSEFFIPDDGVVKIIASEVGTTISSVIAAWRAVLKRMPRVILASSPFSHLQPPALTFRSRLWPDIHVVQTPLPIGINAVFQSQLRELQAGRL